MVLFIFIFLLHCCATKHCRPRQPNHRRLVITLFVTIVQLVNHISVSVSGTATAVSGGGTGGSGNNNNDYCSGSTSSSSNIRTSSGSGNERDQYCTLHLPESRYLPHFIERYQNTYRYISMHNGTIHIRRGQLLLATCYGSQFKVLPAKMLEIYCPESAESHHNEMVVLHQGIKLDRGSITPEEALLCRREVIGSYAVDIPCCHQYGISSGFFSTANSNATSFRNFVKLVDFCFDPQHHVVQFAKYLLASRDVRVEEQLKYNFDVVRPAEYANITRVETHSNTFDHLLSQTKFIDKIKESFGGVAFGDEFIRTTLVPQKFFFSQFGSVTREPLATVIQWAALNHGNWQAALNDLAALAQQKTAVVYAGTSGKLFLSDYSGKLRQVNIKSELFSNHIVSIPFYFWLVVKTGGNNELAAGNVDETRYNESVAIIFINNPYLKNADIQKAVFCSDISHKVTWLDQLSRTKDIPTMGTAFICPVEKAAEYIPEIPNCATCELTQSIYTGPGNLGIAHSSSDTHLSSEPKSYFERFYDNLGKHPFEQFMHQFNLNRSKLEQNKPEDVKVQRDLTPFYSKTSVEVPSYPYQF